MRYSLQLAWQPTLAKTWVPELSCLFLHPPAASLSLTCRSRQSPTSSKRMLTLLLSSLILCDTTESSIYIAGEMQGCVVPPPEIAREGAEEARASNAVPFQYPDNNEEPLPEPPPSSHDTSDIPPAPNAAKDLGVIPVASSSFCPPYLVLPDHLKAVNLPTSERQHKIITETAKFLRINGGQVEVLLKVKQASNPNFGFLNHDHPLHPYYRWIVDANPRETTLNSAPDDAEVTHSMAPPPSLSSLQQAAAPSAPSSALPLSSEAPKGALLPWRMIAASGTRADDDHPSGVPSPSKTHEPMTEAPRMDNPQVVAPPVPHPLAPVELNESSEKDIASDWTYEEMLRRRQEGRKSKKKDKRSRRSRSRSRSRSRRRTRRSRSRSRSRSRRRTRRSRSSSSSRSKRQKRRSRSRSASRGRSRGKRSRRRESSSSERRGRSASRPRERRPLDRVWGERPRYDPHSRSRSRGRRDW